MNIVKDYLDELIGESSKDPDFAKGWAWKEFRRELVGMRAGAGLTQQDVAERLGLSRERVARIERHPEGVSLSGFKDYLEAIGGKLVIESPAVIDLVPKPGRPIGGSKNVAKSA